MFKKLKEIVNNALTPSSNFKVASIIVDKNNKEWAGVNVEYVIPSNDICAERNAISSAITDGFKIGDLREVHIYAESKINFNENLFTPPCGACRQAIMEASDNNAKIFLYNSKGEVNETKIKDLMPNAFTGSEI